MKYSIALLSTYLTLSLCDNSTSYAINATGTTSFAAPRYYAKDGTDNTTAPPNSNWELTTIIKSATNDKGVVNYVNMNFLNITENGTPLNKSSVKRSVCTLITGVQFPGITPFDGTSGNGGCDSVWSSKCSHILLNYARANFTRGSTFDRSGATTVCPSVGGLAFDNLMKDIKTICPGVNLSLTIPGSGALIESECKSPCYCNKF